MSALDIILIGIGLQIGAIVFLLMDTVITHARRSGTNTRRLRRLWTRLLPTALDGHGQDTARIRRSLGSKTSREAFHSFIDEQLRRERGHSPLALRRLSRATGFSDALQRELERARDPLNRAAAAKTLARLRERVAQEKALELLHSKDPAVVLAAAYATASYQDSEQLLPVFRAVYDHTPITLHGAAELLSGFDAGVCPLIHRLLAGTVEQHQDEAAEHRTTAIDPLREVDRADTAAQVVMIDLLSFYAYRPSASTLCRLLDLSNDSEVLIHLVKAIAKIGDRTAVPRLVDLLTHTNWVVRSQSALALAALEAWEVVPNIRILLQDESLRVRSDAQQALRVLDRVEGSVEVFA